MRKIYLDNSATTEILPEVKRAMIEAMDIFGNPSSLHSDGVQTKSLINKAKQEISKLINCIPEEIVLTSGGSESNNTILNTFRNLAEINPNKNELIISSIEHPSVLEYAKMLFNEGYTVHFMPVDKTGRLNMPAFKNALNNKTALVSIMHANNETGVIQDIKTITELAHRFGALVHTDATQTIGKIIFNVKDLGIDYASFSAHKIGGPKGIGALYIKNKSPFYQLIIGGHQQSKKRAGTENIIGIAGFGEAAKQATNNLHIYAEEIQKLRNDLKESIEEKIPNVIFNGNPEFLLPNILNVSFPAAEGESILLYLDNFGISTSTGSACAAGDTKPSHVLMAMYDDPETAHGSVRFSFGLNNKPSDVKHVMNFLPNIIKTLREISTVKESKI